MVQLIRDNKTPFGNEGRNDGRIGCETHGADKRILHAHETRDQSFPNEMKIAGTAFETGSTSRDAVSSYRLFNSVGTAATRLGKAKVVVR